MCWQVSRLLVLEDMKVIRSLCVPCFPPSYDIVNLYVQMYHKSLANHVRTLLLSLLRAWLLKPVLTCSTSYTLELPIVLVCSPYVFLQYQTLHIKDFLAVITGFSFGFGSLLLVFLFSSFSVGHNCIGSAFVFYSTIFIFPQFSSCWKVELYQNF